MKSSNKPQVTENQRSRQISLKTHWLNIVALKNVIKLSTSEARKGEAIWTMTRGLGEDNSTAVVMNLVESLVGSMSVGNKMDQSEIIEAGIEDAEAETQELTEDAHEQNPGPRTSRVTIRRWRFAKWRAPWSRYRAGL